MPRLNIYLQQDVYELAERLRGETNLSEICARAIRQELDAQEVHRAPPALLNSIREGTPAERGIASAFGLSRCLIVEPTPSEIVLRDKLGEAAAEYLDQHISEDSQVAIAGGRQMWCVVRKLRPRNVRATITALGMHHADPRHLHLHPNTLATFMWLLYSPRSQANIIGSKADAHLWARLPVRSHPSYFVLSSCGIFEPGSSFAQLVGESASTNIKRKQILGDFAYNFFDTEGRVVPVEVDVPQTVIPSNHLQALAARSDARVLLVAGGRNKCDLVKKVIASRLCNVLITDQEVAKQLLA